MSNLTHTQKEKKQKKMTAKIKKHYKTMAKKWKTREIRLM